MEEQNEVQFGLLKEGEVLPIPLDFNKIALALGYKVKDEVGDLLTIDMSLIALDSENNVYEENPLKSVLYYGVKSKEILDQACYYYSSLMASGDDSVIIVDFQKIPEDVCGIAVVLDVYKAKEKAHDLSMVESGYLTFYAKDGVKEMGTVLLETASNPNENGFFAGYFARNGDQWEFRTKKEYLNVKDLNAIVNLVSELI